MTREEAIKIVKNIRSDRPWYEVDVDRLIALGILKVEQPKTKRELFMKAMQAHETSYTMQVYDEIHGND